MAQYNLSGSGASGEITTKVYAMKVQESGNFKYVAEADPGTAEATAAWRVQRVDSSAAGEPKITWADGNSNFDNVATDLTLLTYS